MCTLATQVYLKPFFCTLKLVLIVKYDDYFFMLFCLSEQLFVVLLSIVKNGIPPFCCSFFSFEGFLRRLCCFLNYCPDCSHGFAFSTPNSWYAFGTRYRTTKQFKVIFSKIKQQFWIVALFCFRLLWLFQIKTLKRFTKKILFIFVIADVFRLRRIFL